MIINDDIDKNIKIKNYFLKKLKNFTHFANFDELTIFISKLIIFKKCLVINCIGYRMPDQQYNFKGLRLKFRCIIMDRVECKQNHQNRENSFTSALKVHCSQIIIHLKTYNRDASVI